MKAVIGRWIVAALLGAVTAQTSSAQIIPGRAPIRGAGTLQPARRDTLPDSTAIKWPTPDSVAQSLLNKRDYTITRYQGDTAFFDAERKALDLLAAKKARAIVDRDSQVVVSDSGIYYSEATRHVTTGGHYVMKPGGGQADITGHGRGEYNLAERSVSVTNARFPVNNGEMWYLDVTRAKVVIDSTNAKNSTLYAGSGGSITSCDDSIPDYHFEYREAKRTGNNTIVARPAVLYIKDVPVMWLPFIFSDTRSGRHSGILPPQFGVGDIVRNSPTYRRHVDNAGYYWALSDYMGVGTWIDWRSSAGAVNGDPGWLKYNADMDYKWIDRFLGGRVGASYTTNADSAHSTNLALSWAHNQDFSHDAHLNTSLNYVSSTVLQRQNTFNPLAAIATIASAATFQNKFGPASLSIGGTRKQYPGRIQVDEAAPSVNVTTTPITLGSWLSWTPTMSYSRNDSYDIDQPGVGSVIFRENPGGKSDSVQARGRNSSSSSASFDTPLQIFGRDIKNSFRITQERNNFPQRVDIYDLNTGVINETRVFAATYNTNVDWTPEFALPALARNRFNLTPSVSLQNVDPGPFWVASERTNGQFRHQSKRLTYGLSASPTIFGLFPGVGPFERFRHSITPSIGYNYANKSEVSDEYLLALGRTRHGYLGNLRQNAINFGLTQNVEAKIRPKTVDTTGTAKGDIIRLISITMTPVNYDFERAHAEGVHSKWAGLTTDNWGYSLSSELLPGFDFSSAYSLFQGSTLSDTARFKPYLTSISASFNIGKGQNPLAVLTRLFGKAVPEAQKSPTPGTDQVRPRSDDTLAAIVAATPVAGTPRAGDRFIIPPSQGWRAQFQFSRSSPRPPFGDSTANIVNFDPRKRCQTIAQGNPFIFDTCVAQIGTQPTVVQPITGQTAGTQLYNIPPTMSLNSNISFNLTAKWATQWQTTYDLERHEFASQIVSLQRDMHDWRAIFGFTQSPNGNFAFNFTIALKAEPDLKFDYNRATVRTGAPPF